MSRAHTRASPLSLVERHRADTGDAQVLDMCAARPFVRLADDSAAPSMYRSSSESILNTPWRMSQQHPTITREYSVHACDGSAHSYSDILPAVPAKPAPARIGKARRARSSTAPSSYQSGMDTAYSRAPRSLSFQYPPPPPPKIWRQSSSSLALVPPSPDTAERPRQSASRASADEGFIMLPWPGLGEHLLALLATTRAPGQRPDSSSIGSSDGLPEYASQG
ncbi:hypothetical protein TRAPUB_8957 [Trametes pubescens]|uniref:Uncharacterized protein n=1 Tax=Trametes pubescens TaxID=154538 RepID=A0A1M2W3T5_TRAPU|nr:hypothetical protein TRAPUB_8957 [Trametes pubescens]